MKKILAGMTASCIALSTLTAPAMAATRLISSNPTTVSDSAEALQKTIINVKSRIFIPDTLTEFSYNYIENNYNAYPYWDLTWRDKDYNSSVSVRCDKEGNIFYYNVRNSDEEKNGPKYLKEELLSKAQEEINKIAPNISEKIVFEKATFDGVYNGAYTYHFLRIENGIKMPDNKVTVTLKYDTGEVKGFQATWEYNVEIPSNETKITENEAKLKIGENVKMSLEYRNKTEEINGRKVTKAYLVYVPDKTYLAVDAKTGELYDTHDEFYSMSEYGSMNKVMGSLGMATDSAESIQLTEQELEKIEQAKGLISKEDAVKIITSEENFFIHKNAKAVNARLTTSYDYLNDEEKGYVWNINISDPRDVDYQEKNAYRAYITAKVDAKTGKILSFRSNMPEYYDKDTEEWKTVEVKYSKEECKNILEKFINKTEPEKFTNTKLSANSGNGYVLKVIDKQNIYGGYSYTYTRYNENIEYQYNSINGAVDGVTGKIYSYNTNWTDEIVFESPNGAMNEKEAYNAYVNNKGFELVYEINNKHYIEENKEQEDYYDYNDLYLLEKEARLVYRTNINPAVISPFTGKQLNYNGDVYEDENEKEYNDISGFWAERDIKLITDLNVTFDGDSFLPSKDITKEEFMDVLNKIGYYSNNKDEEKDKEKITKLDTIKLIIDSLGLSKVAELKDIYKVEFSDLSEIKEDDIGYVAIAKALGIVNGDVFGNLTPNKNTTRAEAVVMALKLINCNFNR